MSVCVLQEEKTKTVTRILEYKDSKVQINTSQTEVIFDMHG